jgi:O-antigen/teichoic acid export membrane protein
MVPTVSDVAVGGAVSHERHFQRSTLFLVANTATTGVFGALFWLVAARMYSEEEVGVAVAAASLLLALAFASQLNGSSALSRFLPSAGPSQRQTVIFGYRVGIAGASVVGAGVLLVSWARGGSIVGGGDWPMTVVLAVSLPLWVVFALQDNVLTAVRQAHWVPVENGLVTGLKFALLPLCVGLAHGTGILVAWVLPALLAVPIVNWALFRRYLAVGHTEVHDRRAFMSYAVRDLPGQVSILFAMRLVPLIVVEVRGSQEGAFIGLPWSILTVAALALPTLALALLAELSRDGADPEALQRRASLLILGVLFPLTIVGAALSSKVLAVAGSEYAARGAAVLAWGILGLAPAALIESGLATYRSQGRLGTASSLQMLRSVALLAVVCALVASSRLADIGKAFLLVNVAALALVRLLDRRSPK